MSIHRKVAPHRIGPAVRFQPLNGLGDGQTHQISRKFSPQMPWKMTLSRLHKRYNRRHSSRRREKPRDVSSSFSQHRLTTLIRGAPISTRPAALPTGALRKRFTSSRRSSLSMSRLSCTTCRTSYRLCPSSSTWPRSACPSTGW